MKHKLFLQYPKFKKSKCTEVDARDYTTNPCGRPLIQHNTIRESSFFLDSEKIELTYYRINNLSLTRSKTGINDEEISTFLLDLPNTSISKL
jgi:hypothetical protein